MNAVIGATRVASFEQVMLVRFGGLSFHEIVGTIFEKFVLKDMTFEYLKINWWGNNNMKRSLCCIKAPQVRTNSF